MSDPEVVIIDELPDNDPDSLKEVVSLIRTIGKDRTVIVTLDRASTVKLIEPNQVILLNNGAIIEAGNPLELEQTKSSYADLLQAETSESTGTKPGKKSRNIPSANQELSKEANATFLTTSSAIPTKSSQNVNSNAFSIMRVLIYALKYKWLLALGSLASLIRGAVLPFLGWLLSEYVVVLMIPTT